MARGFLVMSKKIPKGDRVAPLRRIERDDVEVTGASCPMSGSGRLVKEAPVGNPGLGVWPLLPSSSDERGNDQIINLPEFAHPRKNVDGWNCGHPRQRGATHVLERNHHRQMKLERPNRILVELGPTRIVRDHFELPQHPIKLAHLRNREVKAREVRLPKLKCTLASLTRVGNLWELRRLGARPTARRLVAGCMARVTLGRWQYRGFPTLG